MFSKTARVDYYDREEISKFIMDMKKDPDKTMRKLQDLASELQEEALKIDNPQEVAEYEKVDYVKDNKRPKCRFCGGNIGDRKKDATCKICLSLMHKISRENESGKYRYVYTFTNQVALLTARKAAQHKKNWNRKTFYFFSSARLLAIWTSEKMDFKNTEECRRVA